MSTAASIDTDAGTDSFAAEWRAWHQRHEQVRAAPHGFLAVTGLYWLTPRPQRFPDAPGEWHTGPDGVVVTLADGEAIVVDGQHRTGRYAFGPIAEREGIVVGVAAGPGATGGAGGPGRAEGAGAEGGPDPASGTGGVVEVARRGGHDIVRPRHPDHPLRTAYRGTPTYPPTPRWALTGRFVPFDEPRPTTVGAVVDDLRHVYHAPGRIEFEADGLPLSLTAFDGAAPGSLTVLFTDATSGTTTYPANRALSVGAPDSAGNVTLDFNRATNLPCAYTDFATCPLPPAENRLPVAVEAGEKIPYERPGAPAPTAPDAQP